MTEIERLALWVALCPPVRRSQFSVSAQIPWKAIEELRAKFDEIGIDWRKLKADASKAR